MGKTYTAQSGQQSGRWFICLDNRLEMKITTNTEILTKTKTEKEPIWTDIRRFTRSHMKKMELAGENQIAGKLWSKQNKNEINKRKNLGFMRIHK